MRIDNSKNGIEAWLRGLAGPARIAVRSQATRHCSNDDPGEKDGPGLLRLIGKARIV